MPSLRLTPGAGERRVIVGDSHGDHENTRRILLHTGVIDTGGNKLPGTWACHIGDVIHGGHDVQAADTACLELALSAFDCLILGNHETPFTHGFGAFAGMNVALDCQSLVDASVRAGRWTPATSVDGFLLVHAGLHPILARHAEALEQVRADETMDAEAVAAALRDAFAERVRTGRSEPLFDGIASVRGGRDPHGGIFWCDWAELMRADQKHRSPIAQIVGHTPRRRVQRTRDGRFWCVDLGAALSGRLGALVRDGCDGEWRPVEVGRGNAGEPCVRGGFGHP